MRADGGVSDLGEVGTLLGIVPDVRLTDVRFRLRPGDTLLLYTDGVVEARRPLGPEPAERPFFGERALAEALADCRGQDAHAIISHLSRILADYTAHWASDDTAILALRCLPPPGRKIPAHDDPAHDDPAHDDPAHDDPGA